MADPIGPKIQNLEKVIIANLKETELVEHPHFYHRNLRDMREPLSLCYKVAEVYRTQGDYYDPLIEIFPLMDILRKQYPGVLEIKTNYDEATQVRTLKMKLEFCPIDDIEQFKYDILLRINDALVQYLRQLGKTPVEKKKPNKEKKKK